MPRKSALRRGLRSIPFPAGDTRNGTTASGRKSSPIYVWEEFHVATVVVGGKDERIRAAELVKTGSAVVYNLAGKTTLVELAGLLRLSALHLGVDSAAPHIAAAVGTPTITIYGPSDWREWAPIGEHHRVVVPPMECVPCRQKGCDGKEWSRCLETLETGQVQEVIREALGQVFPTP